MAKPPEHLRQRQIIEAPASRNGPPPKPRKPRFASEAPTRPNRNEEAARWAVIAEVLPGLDRRALSVLGAVAAALGGARPDDETPLIQHFDAMGPLERVAFAAVVYALASDG